MERLTSRNENGRAIFAGNDTPVGNALRIGDILERLAEYEETGLTPEMVKTFMQRVGEIVEICERIDTGMLTEIYKAAQDDRLFITPVKVGDMLWAICWDRVAKEWVVDDNPERVNEVGSQGFFVSATYGKPEEIDEFYPYEMIGDEYFRTREEALEAAATKERPEEAQGDG